MTNIATQIPKDPIGGYTQNNSAVSTVTTAIQAPNTFYWLKIGIEAWECTWYNFADISLWSDYGINKSIYDPCPYGYRVPNNGSWTGFSSTTWVVNTLNEGALWSSLWWPATGYRYSNNGTLISVGYGGYYWSSTRPSTMHYAYYLHFDCSGTVGPSNGTSRGNGFPVRCVQERAKKG